MVGFEFDMQFSSSPLRPELVHWFSRHCSCVLGNFTVPSCSISVGKVFTMTDRLLFCMTSLSSIGHPGKLWIFIFISFISNWTLNSKKYNAFVSGFSKKRFYGDANTIKTKDWTLLRTEANINHFPKSWPQRLCVSFSFSFWFVCLKQHYKNRIIHIYMTECVAFSEWPTKGSISWFYHGISCSQNWTLA